MTERLYYDNAYLTEFDAVVAKTSVREGKHLIALDRSAFYPTSGGQPYDTGTINDAQVSDVFVDDGGELWHEVSREFALGEAVHGQIDWPRRFEHMQQHGGEHMIAGAIWELTGGMTIGLHLGAEFSTIDVEYPDGATRIPDDMIRRVEDLVNSRIQQDVPVKCWFPDADELAALPLRKAPTVKEHVRIVAFGDFEMVACGGTHPSSSGQIGLVKILGVEPARGKMRVSFVCGGRALGDYYKCFDAAWNVANQLSTRPENIGRVVENLQNRLRDAERELARLRRETLFARIPEALANAEIIGGGVRLVSAKIEADAQLIKDYASKLIEAPQTAVLLAADAGEKHIFVFARSVDVPYQMGRILSEAAKKCGAKGGGRPDFAQGGGPAELLDYAKEILLAQA